MSVSVREPELRAAAMSRIGTMFSPGCYREEFGVLNHTVRADAAGLRPTGLWLFEFKSDFDSLRRLPRQAEVFSRVADFCVLVTGPRHRAGGARVVPQWWGIWRYDGDALHAERQPEPNTHLDADSLAQMLWTDELVSSLKATGGMSGLWGSSKVHLAKALAARLPLDSLQLLVHNALRARTQGGFS